MKYIAEISSNHNGSLERAKRLVIAAADSGATHCKFQTYNPEQMAAPGKTIESGPWAGRDMRSLYWVGHTPREWHAELFALAREVGVVPFSSPFHPDDVEFLETLDCPIYKIASCELTYLDLIEAAAKTKKPLIMSTGMASIYEVDRAIDCAVDNGAKDVTLLKCTAAYPASPEDANLATMCSYKRRYYADYGVSDHTTGNEVAVVAAALGASVIEKHFTLSREDGGLDSEFSLEPDEFAGMVEDCELARKVLGAVTYGPAESEKDTEALRRSLWFADDLPAGHVITKEDIAVARPANGLPPYAINDVIGKKLSKRVNTWDPVTWEVIDR